jgi:hypothetical protein
LEPQTIGISYQSEQLLAFFLQNNFLVSDNGEEKVFIIFFYEISDFPDPSEQFFLI